MRHVLILDTQPRNSGKETTHQGFTSMNRGQRISEAHPGGRHGLIPGALLTSKAAPHTGDYHSETDGNNLNRWVEESFIPNLDQHSVIVNDSASYDSMETDNWRTSNTWKADR